MTSPSRPEYKDVGRVIGRLFGHKKAPVTATAPRKKTSLRLGYVVVGALGAAIGAALAYRKLTREPIVRGAAAFERFAENIEEWSTDYGDDE